MAVIPHSAWTIRGAEFAEEVVGPLGLVLDRREVPAVAASASEPVAEFVALAAQEGFTRLGVAHDRGGAGLDRGAEYDVLETLAAADAGLTALLAVTALCLRLAGLAPDASRREPGCGCVVAGADGPLSLRRDGTGWRLRGATRRPITAAAVATHAAVACIDATASRRYTLAIVSLDRAGVQRVTSGSESGLRGRLPAWLSFDQVRLERGEVLPAHRGGELAALSLGAAELLSVAAGAAGIARAAYEGAARWRAEHGPDAGAALARMRWELDMARGAVRCAHEREYGRLDAGAAMRPPDVITAHALAASTAMSLARRAIALCGATVPGDVAGDGSGDAGVRHLDGTRFHPHKLLRDATAASAARPGRIRPAAPRAAQPQRIGSMEWAT